MPQDNPSQVRIYTEHRHSLVSHMSICYLADTMSREGAIASFPRFEQELDVSRPMGQISPFIDYQLCEYQDYKFFLKVQFQVVPAPGSATRTGSYTAPAWAFTRSGSMDEKGDVEVSCHIYDPVLISDLPATGREHIRWLAMEYRHALVQTQQTYVIRDQLYMKKMNLSNDPAAWSCWELLLKGEIDTTMVVLMRRQYLPPMCDSVQDCVIIYKCPTRVMDRGGSTSHSSERSIKEEDLQHEAELTADSFCSQVSNMSLCIDLIQAKLDALMFDEDGYAWAWSRMKLRPHGEGSIDVLAHAFLKGVLLILLDQHVLQQRALVDEITQRIDEINDGVAGLGLDPLSIGLQALRYPADGRDWISLHNDEDMITANAWHARVARYLAFCVDGGLLPGRFALKDIMDVAVNSVISSNALNSLTSIMDFLLHIRPTNLRKPWEQKKITFVVGNIGESTFNDRVMQSMLEHGYMKSCMCQKGGGLTHEYATLMSDLLVSEVSSTNLKASICRMVIAETDMTQSTVMCPGLMSLLRNGGLFLATYSCAALVNLSNAKEVVKNRLMMSGITEVILQQLKAKDDDLLLYTLMLLVHLTKLAHHRNMMKNAGILPILNDILGSSYAAVRFKRRILVELCSVLGQMGNDEESRQLMLESFQVVDCMLHIYETDSTGGKDKPEAGKGGATALASKALFALKQLCANSPELKEQVGERVIEPLMVELGHAPNLENKDWAFNAIMLMVLLSVSKTCCNLMIMNNWKQLHKKLSTSPLGTLESTRERIASINARIQEVLDAKEISSRVSKSALM
eukprot:TRINITY_DN1801_c0_g2_i1.p1 TRINITY_DN1801_c0_g2~~TRINITY_DN1801_c0_g2_i1.p1  ORF type:complete len:937 (+),score=209.99 TRINITY_DN1801_c0_g2_i1:417-2813(+)